MWSDFQMPKKKVSLEELKRILDNMIENAKVGYQDSEWYKPLVDLGVIEEPSIITDDYYDAEAVEFARRLLDFIEEEQSPQLSEWYSSTWLPKGYGSESGYHEHTEVRRYGQPRTEEERLERHYERYGTTELPPRGTGLQESSVSQIPTCPICGEPMRKIVGNLYQCSKHPSQTLRLPE